MTESRDVRCVHPQDRQVADPTPGKVREQAFAIDGLWSGLVHSGPGASGWHHHGSYATSTYVVEGSLRVEFGPGAESAVEAGPGDFIYIPANIVHREINLGDTPSTEIITRAGTGPLTVNVPGPQGATDGLD